MRHLLLTSLAALGPLLADTGVPDDRLEGATQITQVFIVIGFLAMAISGVVWWYRQRKS